MEGENVLALLKRIEQVERERIKLLREQRDDYRELLKKFSPEEQDGSGS